MRWLLFLDRLWHNALNISKSYSLVSLPCQVVGEITLYLSGSWISVKLTNRQVGKSSSKRRLPLLPRPWGLAAVCPLVEVTRTNSVVKGRSISCGKQPPGSRRTVSRWRRGVNELLPSTGLADSSIQLLEDQEWKACSLRSKMPSKVPSWNSEHGHLHHGERRWLTQSMF